MCISEDCHLQREANKKGSMKGVLFCQAAYKKHRTQLSLGAPCTSSRGLCSALGGRAEASITSTCDKGMVIVER